MPDHRVAAGLSESDSSVHVVLGSPLYRGATIAMFLSGVGMSAAAPQIASFLVNELHASLAVAGLYYLTNLTAPIAGFIIGSRSDRTGGRLNLFRLCAVIAFVGWLIVAASTALWVPFAVSAVVLGFGGGAGSQLFAAINDEITTHPLPNSDGVVNIVRMALTAGWVVGPVAGSFLAAAAGPRVMFCATAICFLVQIVPLGRLKDAHRPASGTASVITGFQQPAPASPGLRAMLPLLGFTLLYVCVYAGESSKYAYLPIYMNEGLRLDSTLSGSVIGIQPLIELALMPVAIVASRRIGIVPLMTVGAIFGVGANLLFALSGNVVGLFAGQILMGGVWGIWATLGIIVAQRLLPSAVATASAVFMSSAAVSSALGGLMGGLAAEWIGLPRLFLVPATLALVAVVGLVTMSRRSSVGAPSPRE